jgi:broad specificity phosphatase PhoE
MKIYLVRHGQTDWNVKRIAQGRTDIPLNETGIAQAEALRDKIKGRKIDVCYSSPLSRARQTAEIVVGGRCDILFNDLLIERCFGSFEGTSPGESWLKYWTLNHPQDIEGLEPLEDVFLRTKKFVQYLRANHSADDCILIVGHGGLLKTMHFNIVGYDYDTDFMSRHFDNGDIWEYDI